MPIYVGTSRGADTINVYDDSANGNAAPVRQIHGPSTKLNGIADIVLDASGNLYVGNSAGSTVTVYASSADGDASPMRMIAGPGTGLGSPRSLAIDNSGNLYVLTGSGNPPGTINVYSWNADGDAAPIRTIIGIQPTTGNLSGIDIDGSNNLYLSTDLPGVIRIFPPGANGAVAPMRTISGGNTGLSIPSQLAFDASDNLYVSNGDNVLVFKRGASGNAAPIRKISGPSTGIGNNFSLAVDQGGQVYATNFSSDFSEGSITVYAAGADGDAAPIRSITGLDVPSAVAVPRLIRELTSIEDIQLPSLVATLFGGVTVDSGGWRLIGGRLSPIGPWGPWMTISEPKRDALIALAIDEIAMFISDESARVAVRRALIEAAKGSIEKLARLASQGRGI
jgi:hypothetical protein